jgi:hypothetical protein
MEPAIDAGNGADDNDAPCELFETRDGGGFIPYAESVLLRTFRRFSSMPAVVIAGFIARTA